MSSRDLFNYYNIDIGNEFNYEMLCQNDRKRKESAFPNTVMENFGKHNISIVYILLTILFKSITQFENKQLLQLIESSLHKQ